MATPADIPANPETPPAADPAASAGQARLERDLDRLERLSDYGLKIAEALAARAGSPEADVEGVAQAYGRVARAVRLGAMLTSKLVDDGEGRERRRRSEAESAEREAARAEALQFEAEKAEEASAKAMARRIIRRVIRAEHQDPDVIERLDRETVERLRSEEIYGWVSARPMSNAIAEICEDLGLHPDWDGLGKECWAVEEVASGNIGEPLRAFAEAHPPPASDEDDAPPAAAEGPRLTLVSSLLSGSG